MNENSREKGGATAGRRSKPADDRCRLGRQGEDAAARYLEKRGYRIIARNYRPGRLGEIDIIAGKAELTVFVEVKTRRSRSFGMPQEAVNGRKAARLRALAAAYLVSHTARPSRNYRFDVIAIELDATGRAVLRHIENAF